MSVGPSHELPTSTRRGWRHRDLAVVDEPHDGNGSGDEATEPATGPGITWRPVLAVVAVFLASRVVVLGALFVGVALRPGRTLVNLLYMWDAGWYMNAAENGYPAHLPTEPGPEGQSTIAFFPLFPLSVRLVRWVTGWSFISSGVFVSIVTGLAATLIIWLLVRHLADEESAFRAAAVFSFFPSSLALFLPFAEGIAIALSAACLYFLVRERWIAAGLAAGVATATRPTAMVLVLCCAFAAGLAVWRRRQWRALACIPLAPLGVLAYFTFLKALTGSFTAWFEVLEKGWAQKTDFGRGTVHAVRFVFRTPLLDLNALSATLALGLTIVAFVALLRWRPPAVVIVYCTAVSAMALTSGIGSRPRYMLSAFPLVAALGVMARRPPTFAVLLGVLAGALGAYTILATTVGVQAIL